MLHLKNERNPPISEVYISQSIELTQFLIIKMATHTHTHVSNASIANFREGYFQVARSLRTYWELRRFIF